jgi:hypothetical protein
MLAFSFILWSRYALCSLGYATFFVMGRFGSWMFPGHKKFNRFWASDELRMKA